MVLALRFSMKVTKSASRRVWCSVLVSQPLAHAQVLLECGAQIGHCAPPGQGRLNVRSASMSTFAYIRVVSWLSCRSS